MLWDFIFIGHANIVLLLLKLVTWIKQPNISVVDDSPTVHSVASILTSYITGKRTTFTTNMAVTLHGVAKSREIIDIMHKDGLIISYNDVMMLRDFWVVNDLERSLNCLFELAEGKPAIAVVDNDDFKSDTLTGAGQPHRTNVMFVQPESTEYELVSEIDINRPIPNTNLASSLSAMLKKMGDEMQKINPYKTVKRGEPPIRKQPQNPNVSSEISAQRTRCVIHALSRAKDDGSRPKSKEQTVPGFQDFMLTCPNQLQKAEQYTI